MIRLQPLPQIALTNLQPAFYDVESVTAIEMVSKFYSYLQNLVDDYNSFVTEVNNEIETFENDVNVDIEQFKCCIKKLMSDYIESIDMKISLQDNTIAEAIENQNSIIENAVNYMKNNIVETATSLFNQSLQNGDITANLNIDYNSTTEELTFSIVAEGGE